MASQTKVRVGFAPLSPPYGAGLLLRRTQGGDEIIELGGDLGPLGQPVARKPQHDVGSADAPLRQADAGRGAGATAAGDEALGGGGIKHQILALVRRSEERRVGKG